MTNKNQTQETEIAREITQAILKCTRISHQNPCAQIRVLSILPEFQYRHTCPKCGCHTARTLWVQPELDEPQAKICLHCQHVYERPTEPVV